MTIQQEPVSTSFQRQVEITAVGKMLKEGKSEQFTVMCDESPRLGGDGSAPAPIQYFLLSCGF